MPEGLPGSIGSDTLASDLFVRDVDRNVAKTWVDEAPLYVFTEEESKEAGKAKQVKTEWGNQDRMADWVEFPTGPGTATSGTPSDVTHVVAGETLHYEGEDILVSAVNRGTGVLTLIRGIGSTTIRSIPNNAKVRMTGYQGEQGDTAPESRFKEPTLDYNYCAKFEDACEATGTAQECELYFTGDLLSYEEAQMRLRMMEGFEARALNGMGRALIAAGSDGATDHQRAIMAGVPYYLDYNVSDAHHILTYDFMDQRVSKSAPYMSSGRKLLILAGPVARRAMNKWPRSTIERSQEETVYGNRLDRLRFSEADGILVTSRKIPANKVMCLDMEYIDRKNLRQMQVKRNVQANDADKVKIWGLMECTLRVKNPRAHLIITRCDA